MDLVYWLKPGSGDLVRRVLVQFGLGFEKCPVWLGVHPDEGAPGKLGDPELCLQLFEWAL